MTRRARPGNLLSFSLLLNTHKYTAVECFVVCVFMCVGKELLFIHQLLNKMLRKQQWQQIQYLHHQNT